MEMIIKSKDKDGREICFNPKGRGGRYTVDGIKKKGVTTIIGERFGKSALMWWSENCVYEAIKQLMKHNKKPVDEIQQFEDELKYRVKQIKENASPRHVPAKIISVLDIPRTKNGKIVELAVKNIIEGNVIKNKEALANPEVLEQYKNLKELNY